MENAMKQSNTEQPRRPEGQALRERWEHLRREAPIYWKAFQEWSRIHGRRAAHRVHNVVAGNRAAGPVSFLVCSAALAVALTLTTLYSPSYAVTLDGETVGVVADEGMVQQAIRSVEETGSQLLGYDYRVEGDLEYEFALSLRSDLTTPEELQNYFYNQLDAVSGELRKYQVLVDGQAVGVVKDEDSLNQLLDSMKDRYTTENTVSVRFLDTVATEPVYEVNDLMTIREMEQALQANGNGSTTYTVVAGDTFNAIAYANDMSVSDLKALNPSVDINRLMVGDVLNVKELTPAFGGDGGRCDLCGVDSLPGGRGQGLLLVQREQQDRHPGSGGRGPGGRHHHLCQWSGDWAGHQQHDHPAGAHQDGEGGGHQGEAQDGLLRKLPVAHSGADHLLLRRPVYFWQLQLSLRDRYFRLLWCGHPGCRWRYSHLCGL